MLLVAAVQFKEYFDLSNYDQNVKKIKSTGNVTECQEYAVYYMSKLRSGSLAGNDLFDVAILFGFLSLGLTGACLYRIRQIERDPPTEASVKGAK